MEDDLFLKKMKGVRPFNKEEISPENYKVKKDIGIVKKTKKNTPIKKSHISTKAINSKFNLFFGDINKDLKKGKIKIDRRLDLHGYSLLDAHDKFKKEVKKSYDKNKRCILVITGKGVYQNKNNEELKPKLFHGKIKNSIISWIKDEELNNYILTYQEAGLDHGGDGAIFVYLRKKKF